MTTTSRFGAAVCALALLATGCSLLDVSDPTKIEESEVANGTSAVMMRATALHQLYRAFSFPALYGAIWTDEFLADPALSTTTGVSILEVADRRSSEGREELKARRLGSPFETDYFVATDYEFVPKDEVET